MISATDLAVLPALPADWQAVLASGAGDEPDELAQLRHFLRQRQAQGAQIYPPSAQRFAALEHTPLAAVKVVILGQDPYHRAGQAHGLSFSVPPGVRLPPSLRNIMRELSDDLGLPPSTQGCLTAWADQGVLLLNTLLSVEEGQPGGHAKKGWEHLTHRIVRACNDRPGNIVFVLWGAHAQGFAPQIDTSRHLIVASAHPSPLSAHRGFFGSRPFSTINRFLTAHGQEAIDWSLANPKAGAPGTRDQ